MVKHLLFAILLASAAFSQQALMNPFSGGAASKEESIAREPSIRENCETPRRALATFLEAEGQKSLECFDKTGRTSGQLAILAKRLAKVFDAHKVSIDLEKVPNTPNLGLVTLPERYIIASKLKGIYLENTKVGWIFPKEAIDTIDSLYSSALKASMVALYKMIPDWALVDIFGIDGFSLIQVFFLLLAILAALLIRLIVVVLINHHTGKIFTRHGLREFEHHLKRASAHIGNFIMAITMTILIPELDLNVHITSYLLVAARLGAGLSVVLIAYRAVDLVTHYLLQKALATASRLDDQLVPLFGRGLKIVVIIVGGIFVLQNLDVDVTSLLAGVTIGGLAFSFAAKDTVANLFGSVTIFADKPFLVGDWIRTSDVEGIVELVGFRSTRIRTFYNSLITVPNSKFTESVVDNMGARRFRRSDAKIMIRTDTDPTVIEAFCNGIRAIIEAHPKTLKDNYEVHLCELADYSLKINIFYFTNVETNPQEFRCRHEIFLDILRLAKRMGVQLAVPTQSILIDRMVTPTEITPIKELNSDELIKCVDYFGPSGEGVIAPGPRLGDPHFSKQLPREAFK